MADLFSVLDDLRTQLPGCKVASIVACDSGMQLACVSEADSARAVGADAYQSELHRDVDQLIDALDCDGPLESVVVASEDTTFVSEPVGQTGYLWHVATDAATTLGFTQAIMRKYRSRVLETVSTLVGE